MGKGYFFHLFIGKARGGVGVWDVELEFRASLGPMSHLSLELGQLPGHGFPTHCLCLCCYCSLECWQ